MNNFQKEDIKIINSALNEFEKSFEKDSKDAFALVIFINGCYDTGKFAYNKYTALVHYQQARQSANILESLLLNSIDHFNKAIKSAHSILLESNIVDRDLILST